MVDTRRAFTKPYQSLGVPDSSASGDRQHRPTRLFSSEGRDEPVACSTGRRTVLSAASGDGVPGRTATPIRRNAQYSERPQGIHTDREHERLPRSSPPPVNERGVTVGFGDGTSPCGPAWTDYCG